MRRGVGKRGEGEVARGEVGGGDFTRGGGVGGGEVARGGVCGRGEVARGKMGKVGAWEKTGEVGAREEVGEVGVGMRGEEERGRGLNLASAEIFISGDFIPRKVAIKKKGGGG